MESSINRGVLSKIRHKRRAVARPLFGVIKPYVTWVWLSLEVSVKQTLKSLAVTGFVAGASCRLGVKKLWQRLAV